MQKKEKVVISAINFFEGGPLSVLKDCLNFVNESAYLNSYEFTALVHKIELFNLEEYSNITFVEFSKSRKSYFYRLYYEYIYFKKFAKDEEISFWFSLHDMTPSVGGIPQAVYCHNPSPFNSLNFKDLYIQPTQFFFRLFYRFLYQINIKKNKYVIVQQLWMKNRFVEMFDLNKKQILVAPAQIIPISSKYLDSMTKEKDKKDKVFFFPTFPRPFKNIEVICEAAELVAKENKNFRIIITIDGSENKYAKSITKKYDGNNNIDFIGLIKREEVYKYYSEVDCLIFPSKLETWGLPISEFKQFNKSMLIADLPYAKETVGEYDYVNFFNPTDAKQLAKLIVDFINDEIKYETTVAVDYDTELVKGWGELFEMLLKK
ncbi:glycosyltransferase [uncultured Flavobacterium sp.]|uniref:glycosyltransferase n=1 Tax=uncultured Flavobacterium sp. TaxID=165435 RepID=UPI00292F22DA|nr:glycosyltransferase [uncultured Flavobacterium sp.]